MKLEQLDLRLRGLVILRGLLADPLIGKYAAMLGAAGGGAAAFVTAAAEFEAALFDTGRCWTDYLLDAVLENDNICIRRTAAGGAGAAAEQALTAELALLQQAGEQSLDGLLADAPAELRAACGFLPRWETHAADYAAAYAKRRAEVGKKGYGMFARHHVFTVEDARLVPVRCPDPQRLAELPGYEAERAKVIANTKALLAGLPANNVLLYGDAGTGKSSTVKAIANEYAADGLRLVEVKKTSFTRSRR